MADILIEELILSLRAEFALKRTGIYTVQDLIEASTSRLNATKRWGKSVHDEVLRTRAALIERQASLSLDETEKNYIVSLLKEQDIGIDVLDSLRLSAYKKLLSIGCTKLWDVAFRDKENLMSAGIDEQDALNIVKACDAYIKEQDFHMPEPEPEPHESMTLLSDEKYHKAILSYTQAHDIKLSDMSFAARANNRMISAGWLMLSDIILLPDEEFFKLPHMSKDTVIVIRKELDKYVESHEAEIIEMCSIDVEPAHEPEPVYKEEAQDLPFYAADPNPENNDELVPAACSSETESVPEPEPNSESEYKPVAEPEPEPELESACEINTDISIDKLGLSVRSVNVLHRAKIHTVGALLENDREDLRRLRNLGEKSVNEILDVQRRLRCGILTVGSEPIQDAASKIEFPIELTEKYKDCILRYTQFRDAALDTLPLTTHAKNRLNSMGYSMLSEIILKDESYFKGISSLGGTSVQSIVRVIEDYLSAHHERILAMYNGNDDVLRQSDEDIRSGILELYRSIGFKGLSLAEMQEKLNLDDSYLVPLKAVIGGLIADGELEYVDYRCHRVYPTLKEFMHRCEKIKERNSEIIAKRLDGLTLQATAAEYGFTRERARQIVSDNIEKAKKQLRIETGLDFFDEDYFRYLYETYSFDACDAASWLGIPEYIFNYFDALNIKQGKKSLEEALTDSEGLDAGLRLKIRSYLNRDKILIDGRWVEKNRSVLEEVLARKFCRDELSFEDFAKLYNDFLECEEVPFDEKLYYTDAVIRTRENRMRYSSRFMLWKLNKRLRYYDIDGTDFTELLETLNLDSYENIELSTRKFMVMYPELMEKYDIRDHYELHNLLNKIVQEGGNNCIDFGRMPMIKFGEFDRDGAILNIIVDNAPINIYKLAELVEAEYGYDRDTVIGSYISPFKAYCHNGIYRIDYKAIPTENAARLSEALSEDFYYMDEIRQVYTRLIPGADPEEINPYNLTNIGFIPLSGYALRNHNSLEAYFTKLLTVQDITDISNYRKRYSQVQAFSRVLIELKQKLTVIEFEPNQLINFRKLEREGVSRDDIDAFCEAVYKFVADESYFTMHSLREEGFESVLFELGFSDWFYANLLLSDERFSHDRFFASMVFFKGNKSLSAKGFLVDYITEQGSIDLYDLINDLTDKYGIIVERVDILTKLKGSDLYYDRYLDRYYASESLYFHELDTM